jgi:hypothetical protein
MEIVAELNTRWRVIADTLQWILEYRASARRWNGESFCATRKALLRNIRERHIAVSKDAMAKLRNLPEWHHAYRGGDRKQEAA